MEITNGLVEKLYCRFILHTFVFVRHEVGLKTQETEGNTKIILIADDIKHTVTWNQITRFYYLHH